MSGDVQTLAGELPVIASQGVVADSGQGFSFASGYGYGATRAIALEITPTVMQRFTIIGFNVRMALCAFTPQPGGANQHWAKFGDVWGGIYANSPLPRSDTGLNIIAQNGAQFPADLSTFSKVWDGQNDPIRLLSVLDSIPFDSKCQVIANNTMLASPITVRPSSNLGFGCVITPGVYSQYMTLWVARFSYSILYTEEVISHR